MIADEKEGIKVFTKVHHQNAEAKVAAIISGIRSLHDYEHFLRIVFGFYHPAEHHIQQHISEIDLPDIHSRRHSERILMDLGISGEHRITVADLPQAANRAAAFGMMYVLEGSTRGGPFIRKMLLNLGIEGINHENTCFFAGYGVDAAQRWNVFSAALQAEPAQSEIFESAAQTFTRFERWLTTHCN